MDHEFAIPGKPPPRALNKRGSLPPSPSEADMRRIKLARYSTLFTVDYSGDLGRQILVLGAIYVK